MSVRDESWHRAAGQSGALRAAVFGINDGLVSNLALVMGFAGAATDNAIIVLAGVAGLLAGAFSMGAGEYVSMQQPARALRAADRARARGAALPA